jgi:uncharacterized protein YdaL
LRDRVIALLAVVTTAALLSACAVEEDVAAPRVAAGGATTTAPVAPSTVPAPHPDPASISCESGTKRILVVHDAGTPTDLAFALGAAELTVNLVSPFGAATTRAVLEYQPGEMEQYDAVVYVGTGMSVPPPNVFVDDILRTQRPVLWAGEGLTEVFRQRPELVNQLGWRINGEAPATADQVVYRGRSLTRYPSSDGPFAAIEVVDPARAALVADARSGAAVVPWAVRTGTFTYVAESPYTYAYIGDRYLAWADLLVEALDPQATERHRALVRIEDIGPDTDPAQVRAITDALAARGVPFSLAVYPQYRDPSSALGPSSPRARDLAEVPELVAAIEDAAARGATIVMHGVTHQYGSLPNPYAGVSAADFEFYGATIDAADNVVLTGPVADDSLEWAHERVTDGLAEFERAGLARPSIFEFPHNAGSASSYAAVAGLFGARYERSLYFAGGVPHEQYFPYVVRDVYGTCVVPENLGFVSLDAANNNIDRLPEDIVADAERLLAVRDGVASFFFHPFLPVEHLEDVVDGIVGLGYEFVAPGDLLERG